ncbi:MAG: anthranilate phosphoribosyltransferase, partial [Patescibacteria group bacterium]
AKTRAFEVSGKSSKKYVIEPTKLGFKKAVASALRGGNAEENAGIIRSILNGEKGPKRDVVVLNAGIALYVAGIAKDIPRGIKLAEQSIDSGKAQKALENLVKETQQFT